MQQDLGELLGVVDEANPSPGVRQHVGRLRSGAGRIDGHGHPTDREDAHVGDVPLWAVARQQPDPIAGSDAEGHEAGGNLLDGVAVLLPVEWVPLCATGMVAQRGPLGLGGDAGAESTHDRAGRFGGRSRLSLG